LAQLEKKESRQKFKAAKLGRKARAREIKAIKQESEAELTSSAKISTKSARSHLLRERRRKLETALRTENHPLEALRWKYSYLSLEG
jgi:hypothetical protein